LHFNWSHVTNSNLMWRHQTFFLSPANTSLKESVSHPRFHTDVFLGFNNKSPEYSASICQKYLLCLRTLDAFKQVAMTSLFIFDDQCEPTDHKWNNSNKRLYQQRFSPIFLQEDRRAGPSEDISTPRRCQAKLLTYVSYFASQKRNKVWRLLFWCVLCKSNLFV